MESKPFQCYIFDYLNCEINSSLHKELLQKLNISDEDQNTIKKYPPSTEYHCYFDLGIALCFEAGLLDSIDFYKEENNSASLPSAKYKTVSKDRVPVEIGYDATGKDLVEKLGEPLEKGGGSGKGQISIWLRWKHVQVEIPTRDWDIAKDLKWSALTIFR